MDHPDAEDLYAELLARREAGEAVRIEEYTEAHPELAHELRELDGCVRALDAWLPRTSVVKDAPPWRGLGHAGLILDDFQLVEELGRGGMGEVWVAEQLSLARRVALKLVPAADGFTQDTGSPGGITTERLVREAHAAGRPRGDGIVSVHGAGAEGVIGWIAMELVPGGRTLRDWIDDRVSVAPRAHRGAASRGEHEEVARLVLTLAEALVAAHEVGVVHLDVKPRNVLLTPEGRPKLTDFGLARLRGHTSERGVAGTYHYMSPEQARGEEGIGPASDVFSLGVVLYELLALRRPFEGDTFAQVKHAVLTEAPRDPRELRSRVPLDLVLIARKAMEKRPERRYASMQALADDLRRFLAHEPIRARAPSRVRSAWQWTRRHPAASGVLGVGVAALVVISVQFARTLAARRDLAREVAAVKRLSALQDLDDLLARAEAVWPPAPAIEEPARAWIAHAQRLVDALPEHRARRAALAEELDVEVRRSRRPDLDKRWWIAQLDKLIGRLEALADPDSGLLGAGVDPERGWGMRRRLEFAPRRRRGDGHRPARARRVGGRGSARRRRRCVRRSGAHAAARPPAPSGRTRRAAARSSGTPRSAPSPCAPTTARSSSKARAGSCSCCSPAERS